MYKSELTAILFSMLLSMPAPAADLSPSDFEKLNGGVPAELTCFDMLVKSAAENQRANEKAKLLLQKVFELKQGLNKNQKEKFSFEAIPMFDNPKVHAKLLSSILAFSNTAKDLKSTDTVIGLQKHVQKETESHLTKEKIGFYSDCKKMLYSSVSSCRGFLDNAKLLGECYKRESNAETTRLLEHATGSKSYEARLKSAI